jgi:hypothetical protein
VEDRENVGFAAVVSDRARLLLGDTDAYRDATRMLEAQDQEAKRAAELLDRLQANSSPQ